MELGSFKEELCQAICKQVDKVLKTAGITTRLREEITNTVQEAFTQELVTISNFTIGDAHDSFGGRLTEVINEHTSVLPLHFMVGILEELKTRVLMEVFKDGAEKEAGQEESRVQSN